VRLTGGRAAGDAAAARGGGSYGSVRGVVGAPPTPALLQAQAQLAEEVRLKVPLLQAQLLACTAALGDAPGEGGGEAAARWVLLALRVTLPVEEGEAPADSEAVGDALRVALADAVADAVPVAVPVAPPQPAPAPKPWVKVKLEADSLFGFDQDNLQADGKQVVKSWGQGSNYENALEDAKANAVNDIIFNGIYDGDARCNKIPLVPEVNARTKYENYFNGFFANGGTHNNFVTVFGRFYKRNVAEGVTLEIDVPKLKQQLINDGILKAQ
jgi:hypothetical protein